MRHQGTMSYLCGNACQITADFLIFLCISHVPNNIAFVSHLSNQSERKISCNDFTGTKVPAQWSWACSQANSDQERVNICLRCISIW